MKKKGPWLHLPRRRFLKGVGAGALLLPMASHRVLAEPTSSSLFTLGVASGDPDHRSVVLWTRIAPDPLSLDGGNNDLPIDVHWQVAADPTMRNIVREGMVVAQPFQGHNVRVLADALPANATLYYRFSALGEFSSVGRTRTFAPRAVDPGEMTFALTSCQDYEAGYYNAWRDVVAQDVDFVLQSGDYIYEYGPSEDPDVPRVHVGPEIETVDDYRRRYAQYRLDPDLRAAHEAAPFICTWDDHEVDNNYAALIPEDDQSAAAFLERRSQAYRAYFEVMPLRNGIESFTNATADDPVPADRRLYRKFDFGSLASIAVLDTRQDRDDQACGDGLQVCPPAADPMRAMLGARQEEFLVKQMTLSGARWRTVLQQVMFMRWDLGALLGGVPGFYNVDAWDGYSAQRDRLLNFFGTLPDSNNVVLTGDIHSSWAAELKASFDEPESPIVGTEIVCAGISSTFGGDSNDALVRQTLPDNPHIRYFNGLKRGYALCTVTNSQWRTDFRLVDDNLLTDSSVTTAASWVINNGEPGLVEA